MQATSTTSLHPGITRMGELSQDGVFIYRLADKKFEYYNEGFTKIFDLTSDTVSAQTSLLLQLIITEDQHYLQTRFSDLIENGSISNTEFRVRIQSELKHIQCDAYTFDDATIIGFVKDITKAKEHENYIINYGARKDTLLDMVTHNLYGPLNLAQDVVQNIKKTVPPEQLPLIHDQLRFIQESTQECIDIVNNFLRQEHLESEHIFVKKSRFDIIEKVKATLEKLVDTNPDKKFSLITKLENLYINADSVKFFQTLHNLVSNSIKFTPSGGKIEITVEEFDDQFVVSVKDDGIGIPANLHSYIFQRKSLAGRTGLKGEKSIGLGLPIVKNLVELMGGELWFESVEGKGSIFFMRLPKE